VRLPRGALRGAGAPRPDRQGAGPDGGVPRLDHLPDRPVRRPRDRSLRHPVTPGGAPDPAPEQALRPADERILEQYLSHLRIERGLSANTLAAYRRDLRRYLAELARRDIDATAVDPQQLGRWLQSLRTGADGGSVLSASSAARSLAAVRGLHSFLDAERVSSSGDPARLVPSPALPRRLPHPLAIAQVEALIEAAGRPSTGRDATARALRDRALLEVLYGLGARISETTGLDVDDIDAQDRAAGLRGKGDKHRVVRGGRFALEPPEAYPTPARPSLAGARGVCHARQARPGGARNGDTRDLPGLPRHPADQAGRLAGGAARRGRRRAERSARADQPPHPAPLVRHAPAARGSGRAGRAGA